LRKIQKDTSKLRNDRSRAAIVIAITTTYAQQVAVTFITILLCNKSVDAINIKIKIIRNRLNVNITVQSSEDNLAID